MSSFEDHYGRRLGLGDLRGAAGYRQYLGYLATFLAGASFLLTKYVEHSPLAVDVGFPENILLGLAGMTIAALYIVVTSSRMGRRLRIVERAYGFSFHFFALSGAEPYAYLAVAYSMLFVTPGLLASQVLLGLASALLCFVALTNLMTEKRRKIVVMSFGDSGIVIGVTGYALIVVSTTTILFGFITYALVASGTISVAHQSLQVPLNIATASWFYAFQLLKSVPLADLTTVYNWHSPLEYTSPVIGTLILIFKVIVITPVLRLIRLLWQKKQSIAASDNEPDNADAA